ncbi:MAG: RNA-binding cell elongation regulator Jag/EloR, partial [Lachnospiraceae bacterium]
MNEWIEVTAKTVDDAIIEAGIKLGVSMENMEYEVIEKESSGFLGLNKKPAKIRARQKEEEKDPAQDFLCKVFAAMGVKAEAEINFNEAEKTMNINIIGDDMGMLIGKRGQTLDSLQYLVSLVVNRDSDTYIKVKLDTENYRERRKETLENLAKNIANKVRRTRHSVALEPMNPY